jgi:hypothetical protein
MIRIACCMGVALVCGTSADCWAWGATGHEWISGIAIEKLPHSVPAFVRTPEAAAEIAVLGRELDRSKGAGTKGYFCLMPALWLRHRWQHLRMQHGRNPQH